jgi:uncharacterized membrane protein YdjX (TVP38/TMEM64 family)
MACNLKKNLGLVLLAVAVLAVILGVWWWEEAAALIGYALSSETHAGVFLIMFAVLPLLGFPISAFLVLLGVKFGGWYGSLIMAAGMPVHLIVSFLVANSFMRSLLQRCLENMDYRLPQIPRERALWFSFVFMAVPGLPYTVKNYALPLSGAPFRFYFLSGYLVQGAMGIPFVVAGDAVAGEHLVILAVIFAVMLAIYAGVQQLRRRHGDILGKPRAASSDGKPAARRDDDKPPPV